MLQPCIKKCLFFFRLATLYQRGKFLVIVICLGLPASAFAAAWVPLSLCYDSAITQVWSSDGQRGRLNRLFQMAQKKLNLPMLIEPLPWKRCLRDVSLGLKDGAIDASFNEERAAYASFPGMAQGKLDISRRLRNGAYALYRVRGTKADWNGKQFLNLTGPVAVQIGYSVIQDINKLGIATDETPGGAEVVMRKLLAGRSQLAALISEEGDHLLQSQEFAEKIERLPLPIVEKPYFLIVNTGFYHAHTAQIEQLWTTLAKLREASELRAARKKTAGRS